MGIVRRVRFTSKKIFIEWNKRDFLNLLENLPLEYVVHRPWFSFLKWLGNVIFFLVFKYKSSISWIVEWYWHLIKDVFCGSYEEVINVHRNFSEGGGAKYLKNHKITPQKSPKGN